MLFLNGPNTRKHTYNDCYFETKSIDRHLSKGLTDRHEMWNGANLPSEP